MDAYATVRRGDTQCAVRFSDAISRRPAEPAVGPYRIEVIEPLQQLRLVCDGDDTGIGFDLTWEGSFPAVQEQPHVMRTGAASDPRRVAASRRSASWSGTLHVDGDDIAVDPDVWLGTRDRSWGIRPVGEAEPPGRAAGRAARRLLVAVRPAALRRLRGHRDLPGAARRVPHAERRHAGLAATDGVEQLGWPEVEITYRVGHAPPRARDAAPPRRATASRSTSRSRRSAPSPCTSGPATAATPTGATAGGWAAAGRTRRSTTSPTRMIAARVPFGVIDHVARATCDGAEGWGLFEHGTFGRHDPSGFADWGSVAP